MSSRRNHTLDKRKHQPHYLHGMSIDQAMPALGSVLNRVSLIFSRTTSCLLRLFSTHSKECRNDGCSSYLSSCQWMSHLKASMRLTLPFVQSTLRCSLKTLDLGLTYAFQSIFLKREDEPRDELGYSFYSKQLNALYFLSSICVGTLSCILWIRLHS